MIPVFSVIIALALGACTTATVSSLRYAPATPRTQTQATPVVGAVTAIDQRNERPTQLATIQGGFGNPLKTLDTAKPVKDEVADAFAEGLRARGLLASGAAARFSLRLTIPQYDADTITGRKARITVNLEVLDASGAVVYQDRVMDQESDPSLFVNPDINDLKRMCEVVLARAIDTLLDKPALRETLARRI